MPKKSRRCRNGNFSVFGLLIQPCLPSCTSFKTPIGIAARIEWLMLELMRGLGLSLLNQHYSACGQAMLSLGFENCAIHPKPISKPFQMETHNNPPATPIKPRRRWPLHTHTLTTYRLACGVSFFPTRQDETTFPAIAAAYSSQHAPRSSIDGCSRRPKYSSIATDYRE